jgi:hypothetical protein
MKPALVLGMAGAMALGSMTASEARSGRWVAGAAIGLVGAAVAGAAIANANSYRYGYYNGYAYGPGYTYAPAYGYDTYAYSPTYVAPAYVAPQYYGPVYSDQPYPYSDNERYGPYYGGYNSNYTGPLRERQLQGRDY